jgi:hypothetical protein
LNRDTGCLARTDATAHSLILMGNIPWRESVPYVVRMNASDDPRDLIGSRDLQALCPERLDFDGTARIALRVKDQGIVKRKAFRKFEHVRRYRPRSHEPEIRRDLIELACDKFLRSRGLK